MGLRDYFSFGSSQDEEEVLEVKQPSVSNSPYNSYHVDTGAMIKGKSFVKEPSDAKHKSKFPWLYDPGKGSRWDFDPILLRELGDGDPWVQMLIQSISKEIANCNWQIVENDSPEIAKQYNPFERRVKKDYSTSKADGDSGEKARNLFLNPCPDYDFTDVLNMWVADLLTIGSLCGVKNFSKRDYDGDELTSSDPSLLNLQPSDPTTFTKDYRGKTGVLDGFYQYGRLQGSSRAFEDPIHFQDDEIVWSDLNPRTNRRYGISPVFTVKEILKLLDLSIKQEQNFWERGAFPVGMVKHEKDADEIELFKQEKEEAEGKPENQFLTINDKEADFIKIGSNWDELSMHERQKWYSKVVSSAFQVPISVVGLKPEEINRATFRGERNNFESNTLGPYLQKIERILNSQVIWKHFSKDIRFEFKPGTSEEQKKSISSRVVQEWNSGLITLNQGLRQIGYDEVPPEEDGRKPDLFGNEEPGEEGDGGSPDLSQLMSVGKPFGSWEDHEDCVDYMMEEQGYSEETAHKVCGSLEQELKENGEYICECLECGKIKVTEEHCKDVPCPECGGKMRRLERPGFGRKDSKKKDNDEALRETENWNEFEVQPSDVEDVKEQIAEEAEATFEDIMNDPDFENLLERMLEDSPLEKAVNKNSSELTRLLNKLVQAKVLGGGIQGIVTSEAVDMALDTAVNLEDETGLDVDKDSVRQRVENQDMEFAENYSERMEEEIRDTVTEAQAEGKSLDEVKDELMDKKEDFTENQAETIARTEMHRASARAQRDFAQQHSDKFGLKWVTAGDDRVRPGHQEMDEKWRRPSESWEVPYEEGTVKEEIQGNSRYGINCRCTEVMVPLDELDDKDHNGV